MAAPEVSDQISPSVLLDSRSTTDYLLKLFTFPAQVRSTSSALKCYALRLGPGEEIKSSLQEFVKHHDLQAAFILTCVGSVQKAKIRLAHATATNTNEVRILPFAWCTCIVDLVCSLSHRSIMYAEVCSVD